MMCSCSSLAHLQDIFDEADRSDEFLALAKTKSEKGDKAGARRAIDNAIGDAALRDGPDSIQLLLAVRESARLYYKDKDLANAEKAAKWALLLEKVNFGEDSEESIETLNIAIAAACAQDRCADTTPLLEQQLLIRRKHLGNDHPHVAVSLSLLGEAAEKKGDFKLALKYFEDALSIRKKKEPQLVALTEKNLERIRQKQAKGMK